MVSNAGNGNGGIRSSKSGSHSNHNHNHANQPVSNSLIRRLVWLLFVYSYGLLIWFVFLLSALRAGTFFKRSTEKEDNDFAIARDTFWNLSKQPIPGLQHEFFKTRGGYQLHYLTNQSQAVTGKDLILLIHGFPNSCMVWRYLLKEPALPTEHATIVAVDLPGFGGSDSMKTYNTEVLETLAEFIVAMRDRYGTSGDSIGSTVVVGHDWGCVLGMRLAAEAPSLADRFILVNGPLIELAKANLGRAINSSHSIFRQFQASPRNNFGCLAKSFKAIKPLLRQLLLSGYVFVFQLPAILVRAAGGGGNLSLLKGSYRAEHGGSRDEFRVSESMAASLGPGTAECKSKTLNGEAYGASVLPRAKSVGETFWQETAYYRDGLAFDHWDKSIETVAALYNLDSDLSASESPSRRRSSSASSALFTTQVKGALYAPSTILWGEDDLALTQAICLDGIGDYLGKESEVITFKKVGHWPQIEKGTRKILAQIIGMFANGGSKQRPSYIAKEVQEFDTGASLLIRK